MEPRTMVSASAPLAVRPRTENTAREVHGTDVLGPPLGAAGEIQTVVGLEPAPDNGGSTQTSTDPGAGTTGTAIGEDASYAAFARAHRGTGEQAPGSFPWDRNRDGWVDDPISLMERQHAAQAEAARSAAQADAARIAAQADAARIAARADEPDAVAQERTAGRAVEPPPVAFTPGASRPGESSPPTAEFPEIVVPGLDRHSGDGSVAQRAAGATEERPPPEPARVELHSITLRAPPSQAPSQPVIAAATATPVASPAPRPEPAARYSIPELATASVSSRYL